MLLRKPWVRRLGIGGLGVGVLVGLLWAGLEIVARHAERQMERQADAFLKKYPKTVSNVSAQQLDQILVALQLDPVLVKRGETAKGEIDALTYPYFEKQLRKVDGGLDPLPPQVQPHLNTHQSNVRKAQDLLLGQELPVWMFDVERAARIDYPYLTVIGLFRLHKLLLLQAIAADRSRNFSDREKALAAAWRVQEALAKHPLVSAFTPSMVRSQLGIMRHMDGLSPQWQTRITSIAQPSQMMESLKLQNWLAYQSISRSEDLLKTMDDISNQFLINLRFTPPSLFRLQNANTAQLRNDSLQEAQALILQQKNFCTITPIELEPVMPWWNTYGNASANLSTTSSLWSPAGATALTVEFTQKILQLKQLAAQQNQWPKTLKHSSSQACTGVKWQYEVTNTVMSLTLVNPEPLTEGRTDVVQYTGLP